MWNLSIYTAVKDQINREKIIKCYLKFIDLIGNKNKDNEKDKPEITVYTDGSLITGDTIDTNTRMGFGWTTLTEPRISMKGKVEKWPSFTRAELTAIWTVILAIPSETRVRIKTDSQAAIDGINAAKLIPKGSK